ncbi:hypothetical protein ABPG75_013553 [Micractinium tetrahymenae]
MTRAKLRSWAALAPLLALAAVCHARLTPVEASQARLLLQAAAAATPAQQQCDARTSSWDYYPCYNATSTTPPPRVQSAGGPGDALPPCLPGRWAGDKPEQANCTAQPNPFLPKDGPKLVETSGGTGVSGGPTLGYRTGGAQDVENFRKAIEQDILPLPTDITYEGLIKQYYFDTSSNASQPCQDLFCPIYSLGLSPDPLRAAAAAASGGPPPEGEVFMAVGLDSGLKVEDFKRPTLHLVIVLDVSGSMGSPFDRFYYDSLGNPQNLTAAEANVTKIDIAKEVLQGILDQLRPDDIFSIVLFSDGACAPKHMGPVRCADIPALKKQIVADVNATSGTDFSAGLDMAVAELAACKACKNASMADVETRIMVISDEQPNLGDTSQEGLGGRLKSLADQGIFTTIIGVGLDFNSELAEAISKVKGALYFSVHSPGEFQQRLVQDFDFAVTPLVFDLALSVDPGSLAADGGNGWRILHVYGSPNPNDTALSSDGTVMRIDTLFPSPKTEQGIKGGVVLLRMAPPQGGSRPLQLAVGYTDREGRQYSTKRTVAFPQQAASAAAGGGSFFESSGVEKAVLLARYADMLEGWLVDQWKTVNQNKTVVVNATLCSAFPSEYCPSVDAAKAYGVASAPGGACELRSWLEPGACLLPVPVPVVVQLGQWERQSHKLEVLPQAKSAFSTFLPYLRSEMAAVQDPGLQQEVDVLNKLISI